MKKYSFLFPGQGSQIPGMAKDICAAYPESQAILDRISVAANEDIAKLLWDTELAVLSRSDRSQLAITAASIIVVAALETKGIKPSVCMGFSLGEFPALYCSGILELETLIKVVKQRGEIMQSVCDKIAAQSGGNPPGMAAVIGLPPNQVEAAISGIKNAYPANFNSPVQTVIAGTAESLAESETACKNAGARRVLRLKVAGPFHSPLMEEAAVLFEKSLKDVVFNDPKITVFSNVSGKQIESGEEAKKAAVLHLTHPVRWTDEEALLATLINNDKQNGAESNTWQLLETGPGTVFTGLWDKSGFIDVAPVKPCGTQADLAEI